MKFSRTMERYALRRDGVGPWCEQQGFGPYHETVQRPLLDPAAHAHRY